MLLALFNLQRPVVKLQFAVLLTITLFGCQPTRNITYLSNLGDTTEVRTNIVNQTDLVIQPNDLLAISVTSLSVESNALFTGNPLETNPGYLVDENGYVDFPLIGRIELSGLTREQAKEKMTAKLNEHVKYPIVNIRFLNFRVTVLGEVTTPASFTIPTDKINIFEALGLAGDMTVYGKRENVLLIREEGAERTTVRLNLNDKEILNSPYFYLQQNDVIYIEPDKAKVQRVNPSKGNVQFIVSMLTSIITVTILVLTQDF
jgi:polysaccharide biosynthesis/export protein